MACQECFTHFEPSQLLSGAKMGHPEEKQPDHLQTELGWSRMWPELGSHPQRWGDEWECWRLAALTTWPQGLPCAKINPSQFYTEMMCMHFFFFVWCLTFIFTLIASVWLDSKNCYRVCVWSVGVYAWFPICIQVIMSHKRKLIAHLKCWLSQVCPRLHLVSLSRHLTSPSFVCKYEHDNQDLNPETRCSTAYAITWIKGKVSSVSSAGYCKIV